MNLIDLYNQTQKTASVHREPDEWDREAAAYGMSTEDFMDKVAEIKVAEEAELIKVAEESKILGEVMADGYFDAMNKYASANPVRDGVPEIFIKIAQCARAALINNLVAAVTKQQ